MELLIVLFVIIPGVTVALAYLFPATTDSSKPDQTNYSYDTSFSRKPGGYIGSVRGPYSFDITERMSYGNDDY